jgi:hypothetical protein
MQKASGGLDATEGETGGGERGYPTHTVEAVDVTVIASRRRIATVTNVDMTRFR